MRKPYQSVNSTDLYALWWAKVSDSMHRLNSFQTRLRNWYSYSIIAYYAFMVFYFSSFFYFSLLIGISCLLSFYFVSIFVLLKCTFTVHRCEFSIVYLDYISRGILLHPRWSRGKEPVLSLFIFDVRNLTKICLGYCTIIEYIAVESKRK